MPMKIEIANKDLPHKLTMWIGFGKAVIAQRGPTVEVVLHDLTDPAHSVVFVGNGKVTDRHVGQGLRHLVREVLEAQSRGGDAVPDYWYYWKKKLIYSKTVLIRDDFGELIGAFCVNEDVTSSISAFEFVQGSLPGLENVSLKLPKKGEVYFKKPAKEEEASQEIASVSDGQECDAQESLFQLTEKIIESLARDMGLLDGAPKRAERLKYLKDLEARGVFLLKGSIEKVASVLGLSKVTIYSDLTSMKKKAPKTTSKRKAKAS